MTVKTHSPMQCDGEHCVVHNPSDHHMNTWPIVYRMDRAVQMPSTRIESANGGAEVMGPVFVLAERTCPHGIGHPDPDSIAFARRRGGDEFAGVESVHGCDGCCRDPHKPITDEETRRIAEWYDTHCSVTGDVLPPGEWAHGSKPAELTDEEITELLSKPLKFLPDDHPAVIELRAKFCAAIDAQGRVPIVLGLDDDEDPAEVAAKFDQALAEGEQVTVTAPPPGWTGEVKTVCAHCKQVAKGYSIVEGKQLCHTGAMPPWKASDRDCYRLVTVYKHPLIGDQEHTTDGPCWCTFLTETEVGQLYSASGADADWRPIASKALIPWDEPIWLALKPREKMDGTYHPVVLGYYDGEGFAEYSGMSLDDEVTHWADSTAPKHPALA